MALSFCLGLTTIHPDHATADGATAKPCMADAANARRSSLRRLEANPEKEFSRRRMTSRVFADVFPRRWHGDFTAE